MRRRALRSILTTAMVAAGVIAGPRARAGDDPAPPARGSALATASAPASAPPAAPASGATAFQRFFHDVSAGSDLVRSVPSIAVFDGSWSIALQIGSALATRAWRAPYPDGIVALEATRVLYGSSWTAMLGVESLAAIVASGGRFDWLAEAHWRTDWIFGLAVPAPCPRTGAYGGCGIGVGGFGGIHVRPLGSRWWFEVSGGWVEQRVANDERRTLAESAWVMTPIAAAYAIETTDTLPVVLRARAGPGLYFGMHNAHVHPTELGARTLHPPWHEIYPLDAGAGPGGRVEAHVVFGRRLSIDGELVLAPFLVGGPTTRPSHDVAPLDARRGGLPTWRRLAVGASWDQPELMPMRVGISLFAAELSGRPVARFGHQGVMLRFDFPLRVSPAEL